METDEKKVLKKFKEKMNSAEFSIDELVQLYEILINSDDNDTQQNLANYVTGEANYCNDEQEQEKLYKMGSELYKKLADKGNNEAMLRLYEYYKYDYIKSEDNEKYAREWLKKSADNGNLEAIGELSGISYMFMFVKPEQYDDAITLYKKPADMGNVDAQEYMGDAYLARNASKEDKKNAIKYYAMAGRQRNSCSAFALRKLAGLKSEIEDFEEEYEVHEAVEHYLPIAEKGDRVAQITVAHAFHRIDYYEDSMEWFEKAMKAGSLEAGFFWGYYNMKENAKVLEACKKAIDYWEKLALERI